MKRMLVVAVTVAILLSGLSGFASGNVGMDVFVGNSWHSNQAVNIGGHSLLPEWETRPFDDYWYYAARIRWGNIEVEWLHDKVYMGYDTADIQGFNISDGYNFVLFNAVQKWGPWEGRLGAGPAIVHPEGTVNGYYIGALGSPSWRVGGIGFQGALGYRGDLRGGLSYIVEGKLTTGVVHLTYPAPVHEVYAPVSGFHLLLGVGYDL